MKETTTKTIQVELTRIEAEEGVSILFACESGSRAWGFESVDSDFDVRFIYLRPTSSYLTLHRDRGVIEGPLKDGIDLSGWDLIKALDLFQIQPTVIGMDPVPS